MLSELINLKLNDGMVYISHSIEYKRNLRI